MDPVRPDRYVTLICGPPCAGKSTLAQHLREPGDFVLDLDVIARRLGSPTGWRHETEVWQQAEGIYRAALNRLAAAEYGTVFVVRCLPNPWERHRVARGIRANRVLVINPGMATCLTRAKADRRPAGTYTVIRNWYRAYQPHPGDAPCLTQLPANAQSPAAAASPEGAGSIPTGKPGTGRIDRTRRNAVTTRRGKR